VLLRDAGTVILQSIEFQMLEVGFIVICLMAVMGAVQRASKKNLRALAELQRAVEKQKNAEPPRPIERDTGVNKVFDQIR
jgi:hypothetical protein